MLEVEQRINTGQISGFFNDDNWRFNSHKSSSGLLENVKINE
jgi:hypothetical protein